MCCNLSGGVALIVWFTTNGMCGKNNTIVCVARASNRKRDCEHDLYCCLLPRCEAMHTCRSGFPIATKWCCDQDVKVVWSSAFTQRTCDRCGSLVRSFAHMPLGISDRNTSLAKNEKEKTKLSSLVSLAKDAKIKNFHRLSLARNDQEKQTSTFGNLGQK